MSDNGWAIFDFYIDDGFTGTNYNRPDFQRMIDDIEAGNVNMVVVKDLSRLGRNYLMTGQYTDIYFPDRGVRFIALNDGIDSKDSDNDIVPFRNILNQMYSTDISKKVRSAVRMKKQKGQFLSNYAPYGYQKDPANRNRLLIEDRGAAVVRRIYTLCASGHGSPYIAKVLNGDGILSPRNHRELVCPGFFAGHQYKWNPETILGILRNRTYKGDMVQGVYDCARFKRTPSKRKPPEDWYITPNTHEAIINDELWHYVQTCLDTRKKVQRSGEPQLFSGLLKCADCGHALAYARKNGAEYYSCGSYKEKGAQYCSQHYINKPALISVVLEDIRRYARLARSDTDGLAARLAAQSADNERQEMQSLAEALKAAEARFAEIDRILEQLYEDRVTGLINVPRFNKLADKYEAEQSSVDKAIKATKAKMERLKASNHDISAWLELIQNYADIQELDKELLGALVEKITVSETKTAEGKKNVEVTIYYRYVGAIRL